MKKPFGLIAVSLVAGVLALAVSPAAHAEDQWTQLRDWLDSYGVSEATTDTLIDKLEAGNLLDSMADADSPVSTTVEQTPEGTEEIATYADGSISVTTIEAPDQVGSSAVAAAGIGGCSVYNGGGFASYSNCRVSSSNGTTTLAFYANYSRTSSQGSISNWRNATVIANYGTATAPIFSRTVSKSSGANPAVVTIYSRFESGLSSEDLYLSLRVSPSQAWTTQY